LLFQKFFGALQGVVEILAKAADDRLLECLVNGHTQTLATLHSIAAYCPAVVVQTVCSVAELLDADGIEMARYGFEERTLALAVGSLDGAEYYAIFLE
jgi:hypothetical protein